MAFELLVELHVGRAFRTALAILGSEAVREIPISTDEFDGPGLRVPGHEDRVGGITYIRQVGNDLWVVGPGRTDGQRAFHGTIGTDLVVHLSWAEVGALTPTDQRTPPWGNGTVDMRISADNQGDTIMTSIAQTGTRLTGPAYSNFSFMPCTPEQLAVPTPAH